MAVAQNLASVHRKTPVQGSECEHSEVEECGSGVHHQTQAVPTPVSEHSAAPSPIPSTSANDKKSRPLPPKTPPSCVVQQLMDMGFGRKSVETALKILSVENVSPSPESLVAWLLEHQDLQSPPSDGNTHSSFGGDEYSDSDSLSDEFEDIDASGHDSCLQQETFKKLSDFDGHDKYSLYVQEHITIGMTVKCCTSFDDILEGDTGKVVKLERGPQELNALVIIFANFKKLLNVQRFDFIEV